LTAAVTAGPVSPSGLALWADGSADPSEREALAKYLLGLGMARSRPFISFSLERLLTMKRGPRRASFEPGDEVVDGYRRKRLNRVRQIRKKTLSSSFLFERSVYL
jgi:hypothetical protein